MLINFTYISLLLLLVSCDSKRARNKRHLIFYGGGGFKLVIGIAVPIKLGIKQSLACGVNFQYQYGVPTNITQLEKPYPPIIGKSLEKRAVVIDNGRALFYLGVEAAFNRHGLNGRACLLRAICDNAAHPVRGEGVWGEILHIALTPLYGAQDSGLDLVYFDAQKAGEYGADCVSLFPECPQGTGIMDMISGLE